MCILTYTYIFVLCGGGRAAVADGQREGEGGDDGAGSGAFVAGSAAPAVHVNSPFAGPQGQTGGEGRCVRVCVSCNVCPLHNAKQDRYR